MILLAVRAIDFAIFGTLGTLWLGGAVFIYLVHTWIRRYEGLAPARPTASGRQRTPRTSENAPRGSSKRLTAAASSA